MTSQLEATILSLRPQLAAVAQTVYDAWAQDEDGMDPELGGGGICDEVAREMAGVLAGAGIDVTDGGADGDDHAWIIAYNETEAFGVDIPPNVYETGAGYSWTKIPNVMIVPDDVEVWQVPRDWLGDMDERFLTFDDLRRVAEKAAAKMGVSVEEWRERKLAEIRQQQSENDGCTASLGAMPSPVIDVVEPGEPEDPTKLTEAAKLLSMIGELVHVPIPCLTAEEHTLLKALCNNPKLQKKLPKVKMKVAELQPTQWRLDQANVRRLRREKKYDDALVLGRRGGKYVRDGHHRTEAAKLDGVEEASHRFLDMGNKPMTLQMLANRLKVDKREIINSMDTDDRIQFEKQP